jgi:alkanesulfonate monooxygenase SsuD/methylene tetrahydromethanopterin reductase-like flavin-dependent oxidoreductase (luciferase family)
LRLGIGIGWNPVEYEALGENFHNRGRRSEEQVDVMRQLWTKELVTYKGRWHKITDGGINPLPVQLPVQRPIPLWFGGVSEPVMKRLACIGDGWFPQRFGPDKVGREQFEQVRAFAREAGRDPDEIGFEPRISVSQGDPDTWLKDATAWKELGATHLSVNTMGAGCTSPQDHIDAIKRFKDAVGII